MPQTSACPFCQLTPIAQSQWVVACYDKNPVAPGHCLIMPKRHVATWFDMTPQEQQDAMALIEQLKLMLDQKHSPDGYNIGMNCGEVAGQTIPHAHIHLIPRYRGDLANPRGGVRGVIPAKQNY